MKRVIAVLMILGLVSAANAAYTDVNCECSYLSIITNRCKCKVDTTNPDVSNMCKVGLQEQGFEVFQKGFIKSIAIEGLIVGATIATTVYSVAACCLRVLGGR